MEFLKRFLWVSVLCLVLFWSNKHKLGAEIVQVEGESRAIVTVYITKRFFSYPGTKNLVYHMYIPGVIDHSFTTQNIKRLRRYITPFPTEVNQYEDEYGNKYLDLIWKKQVRNVQIDLQFDATLYSRYYSISSEAGYPFQLFNEEAGKYLISTEFAPSESAAIKNLAETLIEGKNRELDVVFTIFHWIDENIILIEKGGGSDNESYDNALKVLENRKGTKKGVVNLMVALLRAINIPSRVVYGLSFQKEISIKTDKTNFVFNFPNSTRYWVEVYFPDIGWVAYDPGGLYFCSTPNLIVLSTGPDTEYVTDRWSAGGDDVNFESEYIYDIKSYTGRLKYRALTSEVKRKIVLSPQIPDLLTNTGTRVTTDNEKQENGGFPTSKGLEEFYPIKIENNTFRIYLENISKHVDVDATKNLIYAQRFFIPVKINIRRFQLPLIKFSDGGRIWIDIFEDDKGQPGKRIFRTFSIESTRVRFMQIDNPWIDFPVGKNTQPLDRGHYWFALRSSGNCIFKWYGQEGNLSGGAYDTRFMDVRLKNPNWNNLVNLDMNFRISGVIISEEE